MATTKKLVPLTDEQLSQAAGGSSQTEINNAYFARSAVYNSDVASYYNQVSQDAYAAYLARYYAHYNTYSV